MTLLRAWPLLVVACGGGSARAVVNTNADFQEVEKAAQPGSGSGAGSALAGTGSGAGSGSSASTGSASTPTTGGTSATPGSLPDSNGPMVFGMLDGEAALEDAWDRWNAGKTTTYDQVFEIAVLANRARPLSMSDELMVIALAKAVEMSNCDPERLGKIRLLAIAVKTSTHNKELDSELVRLSDMGPAECAKK